MFQRRTRPKHAFLLVDPFVRDSVIIREAALRGAPQFLEDLPWLLERKIFGFSQTPRQIADDLRIEARISWRIHGLLNVDHTRLYVGGHAFLFFLQTAG